MESNKFFEEFTRMWEDGEIEKAPEEDWCGDGDVLCIKVPMPMDEDEYDSFYADYARCNDVKQMLEECGYTLLCYDEESGDYITVYFEKLIK